MIIITDSTTVKMFTGTLYLMNITKIVRSVIKRAIIAPPFCPFGAMKIISNQEYNAGNFSAFSKKYSPYCGGYIPRILLLGGLL